jgi:hypothetical protein
MLSSKYEFFRKTIYTRLELKYYFFSLSKNNMNDFNILLIIETLARLNKGAITGDDGIINDGIGRPRWRLELIRCRGAATVLNLKSRLPMRWGVSLFLST